MIGGNLDFKTWPSCKKARFLKKHGLLFTKRPRSARLHKLALTTLFSIIQSWFSKLVCVFAIGVNGLFLSFVQSRRLHDNSILHCWVT